MDLHESNMHTDIAVVGMSARFPGAPTLKDFLQLLQSGKSVTRFFTEKELVNAGYDPQEIKQERFVPSLGTILDDKDKFDAFFFGLTPNEALFLEPQIRILLQAAWHALEDSGAACNHSFGKRTTGIYAGASNAFIWQARAFLSNKTEAIGAFSSQVLVNKDLIAGQVAYLLNLTGPAISVNTACSTSLVAIHLACRALINGECDQALAGGSSMHYENIGGYLADPSSVMSSDGILRAFDKNADGMIAGEGVGLVVLRKLEHAIEDKDRIYAVIKGSSVNNDGRRKAGFTAPGIIGQTEVIKKAQQLAGISPMQVQYVETHGSGTPLGDLVEVEALSEAFGLTGKGYCGLGSVKTNVGHTDAAAGIAGFIKTVLSVNQRTIFPNVNFEVPNPEIDWMETPFYIPTSPIKLEEKDACFMGVSSFGIGGTNAHIVLGPAPEISKKVLGNKEKTTYLLPLSARTSKALLRVREQLYDFLLENKSCNLRDLQYTLQASRKEFEHRCTIMASNRESIMERLQSKDDNKTSLVKLDSKPIIILSESAPFKSFDLKMEHLGQYFERILQQHVQLLNNIFEQDYKNLKKKVIAPLVEVLLPMLKSLATFDSLCYIGLQSMNCIPMGKMRWFAPVLSQQIPLKNVLNVIVEIELARLFPEQFDDDFIQDNIALWNFSEATNDVYSGHLGVKWGKTDFMGINFWRDGFVGEEEISTNLLNESSLNIVISNEFVNILKHDKGSSANALLDFAPMCTSRFEFFRELWSNGNNLIWQRIFLNENQNLLSIPGYPFERDSYWLENRELQVTDRPKYDDLEKLHYNDWFHVPDWKRTSFIEPNESNSTKALMLLLPKGAQGELIRVQFQNASLEVISSINLGERFEKLAENHFTVRANSKEDFIELFGELKRLGKFPDVIVHYWTCTGEQFERKRIKNNLHYGFESVIALAQALGELDFSFSLSLNLISLNTQAVMGSEKLNPVHATMAAAIKSISQEMPYIASSHYDLECPFMDLGPLVVPRLVADLLHTTNEPSIAYRSGFRWSLEYRKIDPGNSIDDNMALKEDGTYLVIGGLGRIGYTISEHLAQKYNANLYIVGRRTLPNKEHWETLDPQKEDQGVLNRIGKLLDLQRLGAKVHYRVLTDKKSSNWNALLKDIKLKNGRFDGVFHAAGETVHEIISRSVDKIDETSVAAQFAPKIYTLVALYEALEKYPSDFCVVTSSIASVLGGLGFTAYTAANGFIDSFVNYANRKSLTRWIGVNTAEWRFEIGDEFQQRDRRINTFMTPSEGLQTYLSVLNLWKYPQVIISTMNFEARLQQWVKNLSTSVQSFEAQNGNEVQRPELEVTFVEPKNDIERQLASIWTKILGYANVGTDDNFFDLGGDSLKVIITISNIHKELKRQIPVGVFFSHPTIGLLGDWLIAETDEVEFRVIEKVEKQPFYPVSPAQKRLFVINQIAPDNLGYNETHIFRIHGNLNLNKLEKALNSLLKRHESLRTSFTMMKEDPVQIIHDDLHIKIDHITTKQAIDEEIIGDFVHPFDLAQAPLMRVGLLENAKQEKLLMMDFHHIIIDGVSINILFNDLMKLYKGIDLKPLDVRYRDFTMWQLGLNDSKEFKKQEAFWLGQFKKPWKPIELPLDFPRPKKQSFEGAAERFTLNPNLTSKIKELALKNGATNFMVILSAFKSWLSRLTGEEEIIIGTPASGRRHESLENVVGMFVNTLALRIGGNDTDSFEQLIEHTKRVSLQAVDHQEYPFESLVKNVVSERDMSRHPIFDVVFIFQKNPVAKGLVSDSPEEIELEGYRYQQKATKFDLIMDVVDVGSQFVITFHYASCLFSKETILRWLDSVQKYWMQLVNNPGNQSHEFSILDKKSVDNIGRWNTHAAGKNLEFLPTLFVKKATSQPTKEILIYNDKSYTFQDIESKSNRLCRELIKIGVKNGDCVGIRMNRGVETLVAILAVWKAKAAYVPLSPKFPKKRVHQILENCNAKIVLTNSASFGYVGDETIINVSKDDFISHSEKGFALDDRFDSLACILYTSGSTGIPKGVKISHGGLSNNLYALQEVFPMKEGDVSIFKSAFVFDVSLQELLGWCVGGGKLLILPEGDEREPSKLLNMMISHGVTHVHFVNTMLEYFIEQLWRSKHISRLVLKYVVQGGEALNSQAAMKLKKLLPKTALINLYGPAEATIGTTTYLVEDDHYMGGIPIGKPIRNMIVDILDKHMNSQPIGVYGEIAIAGWGLSQGYMNEEVLSKNQFINRANKTFYLTGDFGRWNANGNLEFLGRKDNQIKLFGNRIEIGEIEKVLQSHVSINRAAVLYEKDEKNQPLLKAYVIADSTIATESLRNFAMANLPSYMIPSRFSQVDDFPQTTSGKLDRIALKGLGEGLMVEDFLETELPDGENEELLAKIWKDVLGLSHVSRHYSFFDYGGDSIRALRLVARLFEVGQYLEVKDIFEFETISALAPRLKPLEEQEETMISGEIKLTPVQNWFFHNFKGDRDLFTTEVLLKSSLDLKSEMLQEVFRILVQHHDQLRVAFRPVNGRIVQHVNETVMDVEITEMDLKNVNDPLERMSSAAQELKTSFRLEDGKLIKAGIFHLDDGDRLFLSIHHTIIDTYSWRVLINDMDLLLTQSIKNLSLKLPNKSLPYSQWSDRLSEYTSSKKWAKEYEFWQEMLSPNYDTFPNLRTKDLRGVFEKIIIVLPVAQTKLLKEQLVKKQKTDFDNILLAAIGKALGAWKGFENVLIAVDNHGRETAWSGANVSRTVGWFTSIYPVGLASKKGANMLEYLSYVKDVHQSVPNYGIGYGNFVYANQEETPRRNLLKRYPQIILGYMGQFDEAKEIQEVSTATNPQVFELAGENLGLKQEAKVPFLIEFTAFLIENSLQIAIRYRKAHFNKKEIKAFKDHFENGLKALAQECESSLLATEH